MLPPQRLAILGYDDAEIGPRERYLPGPPLSHADGKHVAADPLGAAAAARAHVEVHHDRGRRQDFTRLSRRRAW